MIFVEHVSKSFGSVRALHDVSFEIRSGEIVGFLGQNGAGKTTMMRILTTYFPPSSGKVNVAGVDALAAPLEVRRRIGYLPENPPLYPSMTVRDYLRFTARIRDVAAREVQRNVDRVLEECFLRDVAERKIEHLSKGYKQRVGIAQAIIHNPQVLILDEPTSGLDPVQVQHVRRLIKNLEQQRTVILSTHVLSEIELIASRVLIIKSGRILADSSMSMLLAEQQKQNILFCVEGSSGAIEVAVSDFPDVIVRNRKIIADMYEYELALNAAKTDEKKFLARLLTQGVSVKEIRREKPTLEQAFLNIVSEE